MKKAGFLIVILGILLTIFTTVTLFTREKVAKIGDVKIMVNKPHRLNWSPLVGVGVIICGGALFLLSRRRDL